MFASFLKKGLWWVALAKSTMASGSRTDSTPPTGQQGQSLCLVRDGMKLPTHSQRQVQVTGEPPCVSQVKVQEILRQNPPLGGPVNITRSARNDVEALVRRIEEPAQSRQQIGGRAAFIGRDAAGKIIREQRIGISRAETEIVSRQKTPMIEVIDPGPADTPARFDGMVALDPRQIVDPLDVAGVPPLVQEIPDRGSKTRPQTSDDSPRGRSRY